MTTTDVPSSATVAPRRIYLASSWRNHAQPLLVELLRSQGHEVYDFRHPAEGDDGFSWREIDKDWEKWTPEQYVEALRHPAARRGLALDVGGMEWSDTVVLLQPCGRSAHLEIGWAIGSGRETHVLLVPGQEPELMVGMATGLHTTPTSLIEALAKPVQPRGTLAPPRGPVRESEAQAKRVEPLSDEMARIASYFLRRNCLSLADWLETQPSWEEAWAKIDRVDWMFEIIGASILDQDWRSPHRRLLTLAAVGCAETVAEHLTSHDRLCLETAKRHAQGEDVSLDLLVQARDDCKKGSGPWLVVGRVAACAALDGSYAHSCAHEAAFFAADYLAARYVSRKYPRLTIEDVLTSVQHAKKGEAVEDFHAARHLIEPKYVAIVRSVYPTAPRLPFMSEPAKPESPLCEVAKLDLSPPASDITAAVGYLNHNGFGEMAKWVATQPDWQTAWSNCPRLDWMLKIIGQTMTDAYWQSPERRKLAGVTAACARAAWEWMSEAGRACLLLVERHAAGEVVSREELHAAADAAGRAAYTTYVAYAAGRTAFDAGRAAYSADADAASDAADRVAYTTYVAYAAASDRVNDECMAIVRAAYPTAPSLPTAI